MKTQSGKAGRQTSLNFVSHRNTVRLLILNNLQLPWENERIKNNSSKKAHNSKQLLEMIKLKYHHEVYAMLSQKLADFVPQVLKTYSHVNFHHSSFLICK